MQDVSIYFLGYLAVVALLLAVVAKLTCGAFCQKRRAGISVSPGGGDYNVALLISAVGAVAITWYCILAFFFGTTPEKDRFVLAYQQVSEDDFGWMWSSSLLSWALTAACATPFLLPASGLSAAAEKVAAFTGSLEPTPPAARWQLLLFVALGELMAISGAFPLLFVFLGGARLEAGGTSASALVVLLIGHFAIWAVRCNAAEAFEGSAFVLALAVLHAAILAGALLPRSGRIRRDRFLRLAAVLSAMQHCAAVASAAQAFGFAPGLTMASVLELPRMLLAGLVRNYCQYSIGCDGIMAHLQGLLFLRRPIPHLLLDTMLAALLSPGAVLAWHLAALTPVDEAGDSCVVSAQEAPADSAAAPVWRRRRLRLSEAGASFAD